MVFAERLGVVNVAPVPNCALPAASYQYIVPPAQPVAVKVTAPASQRLTLLEVGALGVAFADTVTEAVAVQPMPVSVTVTVNVPVGRLTVAPVAPFDHA